MNNEITITEYVEFIDELMTILMDSSIEPDEYIIQNDILCFTTYIF